MNPADSLFDWIEQTAEGQQFMSDCFNGSNSVNIIRVTAERFGIPLRTLFNLSSGIGLLTWQNSIRFYSKDYTE